MKKIIWVVPVLFLGAIIYVGVINYTNNSEFMNASVTQIITLLIAVIITFYITQYKNDQRKIKDYAESIIRKIQNVVMDEGFISFDEGTETKQITMVNRKMSNYIDVLKKYAEKLNFSTDAKYIEEEFQRYREFVDEHISDIEYLNKSATTLQNHAEKIEQKCDLIIFNLYK